jgi:hypothetical protein
MKACFYPKRGSCSAARCLICKKNILKSLFFVLIFYFFWIIIKSATNFNRFARLSIRFILLYREEAIAIFNDIKKHLAGRAQEFWIIGIVVLIVLGVVAFRRWKPDQYIIGEVREITSASAKLENFDKNDGAYTGDPEKLFITFLPDGCEFFDENGKEITALDITVGSKVKMTSTTGLKTNAEGYTTVEIKKVEVLKAAPAPETYVAG